MDMWGIGCVMYEVLALSPLFPGANETDQIERIHQVLGTPDQVTLDEFKKYSHLSLPRPNIIYDDYSS
jgi:renal tumor antigen